MEVSFGMFFFTMGSIWEVSFGMVYLQCEIWKRFSPVCWPTFSQVLRSLDGLTVVGLMGREGRKICTLLLYTLYTSVVCMN